MVKILFFYFKHKDDDQTNRRAFLEKNFSANQTSIARPPSSKKEQNQANSSQISQSVRQNDDLELAIKRQESLNRNISLYVRVRPILKNERATSPIAIQIKNTNVISVTSSPGTVKQYSFNRVFNENTNETELFQTACVPMLNHCIEGYNSSLFLYGQTGTGW